MSDIDWYAIVEKKQLCSLEPTVILSFCHLIIRNNRIQICLKSFIAHKAVRIEFFLLSSYFFLEFFNHVSNHLLSSLNCIYMRTIQIFIISMNLYIIKQLLCH